MHEFQVADPSIFLSWTPEYYNWLREGLNRRRKEENAAMKKANRRR